MTGQDLGSAIREIERLTKAAHKTEIIAAQGAGEPAGVYYLVGPDGLAQKVVAGPSRHREKLATPAEMAAFIDAYAGGEGKGVTYFDEQAVVYVFDGEDRRDFAVCELPKSPQYLKLAACACKAMGQADFVRLLRIDLRGCLAESNLLPLVRQLKFTADRASEAAIQHGRESIGKQITAAVTGESAIPEEVTLFVPVFENHPFRARIQCAVEVMVLDQAFRLTPYPMEMRQAVDAALEDVRHVVGGPDMPRVFRGQPS